MDYYYKKKLLKLLKGLIIVCINYIINWYKKNQQESYFEKVVLEMYTIFNFAIEIGGKATFFMILISMFFIANKTLANFISVYCPNLLLMIEFDYNLEF